MHTASIESQRANIKLIIIITIIIKKREESQEKNTIEETVVKHDNVG